MLTPALVLALGLQWTSSAWASSAQSASACLPQRATANGSPRPAIGAATVASGAGGVTVHAYVRAGAAGSAFVRFGESPGFLRCSSAVSLPASTAPTAISIRLEGLLPRVTYHFEVGVRSAGWTRYGAAEAFTTRSLGVPAGVSVGPIELGGMSPHAALARLQEFLAAPLRFGFEGVYWSAPRATLGAEIHPLATIARALAATPGSHLRLELTIDQQRLGAYLDRLAARFAHGAQAASIRLVGTRAIVVPQATPVAVDVARMASAIRTALASGLSERLALLVSTRPAAGPHATTKAVVVRLDRQTITVYLNGKQLLTAPVTTGRPALPTPVGSYHVIFRASPFVFHSPWPPGSPYWYPPTPVTWAMDFFNGDFLHDDPGEPTSAFGAGSEDGPYASHGCVHVPYTVMSFLYRWLPNGAQVVVART